MVLRNKLVIGAMVLGLSISAGALASTSKAADTTVPVSSTAISAPINVNSADLQTLENIKGLGPTKAQAIIDYRTKNGHFKTVEEVENVPGIGPKLLQKIQSQIAV